MQVLAQTENKKAFWIGKGGVDGSAEEGWRGHDYGLFVAQVKTALARMVGTFERYIYLNRDHEP